MKKGYKIYQLIWVLCLTGFFADAQELVYNNWGIESPLQTNMIYNIYVAKDGLLYIATDNGFWSYNGLTFQQYQQDGLNTQDVTTIQEDKEGNIYFQNFSGDVFCWTGDTLQLHMDSKRLGFKLRTYVLVDGYFYYWNRQQVARQAYGSDTSQVITSLTEGQTFLNAFTPEGLFLVKQRYAMWVKRLRKDSISSVNIHIESATKDRYNYFITAYDTLPYVLHNFSGKNGFIETPLGDTLFDLNKYPTKLDFYRLKRIGGVPLIGTKQGLYLPHKNQLYLKGAFVSEIIEDQEANIWVSTTTNGLYKITNLNNQLYPKPTQLRNKVDYILKHEKRLIVCSLDGQAYHWDSTKAIFNHFHTGDVGGIKNSFFSENLNQYLISGMNLYYFDKKLQLVHKQNGSITAYPVVSNTYYRADNNFIYYNYLTEDTLSEITKDYGFFIHKHWRQQSGGGDRLMCKNAKSIHKHQQWIIVLHQDTLSYIHDGLLDSVRSYTIPQNSQKLYLKKGRIWVQFAKQLVEYDTWGNVLNTIARVDGVEQNITNYSMDSNYIAISTKQAIFVYHAQTMERIYKFTTQNGIASTDFDKGWIYDGQLYANGSNGVSAIALDRGFNKGKPQLKITNVWGNKSKAEGKEFSYDQNNIQIQYLITSYTTTGSLFWRLNEREWNKQEGKPIITLNELQSGVYKIEAYFENDLGTKTATVVYEFKIQHPFWQTWIGYFLINIGLVGVVILFWRLYLDRKRKKEKQQNQFNLLKLQALQTQMNPHFIFNVQAAIQGLWLEDKTEAALELQTHFSKLLRLIFQYSNKQFISIDELIEFLKHYLELEKIRFEDTIEIVWDISPSFYQDDYFIPPLLIQPILENAFKHGFLHKKGLKKLLIKFKQKDPYFYCLIEDNGVGRQPKTMTKKDEASGLQTTQKRIKLLQETLIGEKIANPSLLITDLRNTQNEPLGTRVEMWIPFTAFQKK